jgi:hypothetical protein
MPDITMCVGTGCPLKEKCYRFVAKADDYQSYFAEPPLEVKDGVAKCDHYWGDDAQSVWKQLSDTTKNDDENV